MNGMIRDLYHFDSYISHLCSRRTEPQHLTIAKGVQNLLRRHDRVEPGETEQKRIPLLPDFFRQAATVGK